jgi:DNA-binding SARP family transcriptional activator/tetratricopeptide (TPR) repeat protein
VEVDGVRLESGLRGKQVRLLLAYLLLNRGRPVGREELIGAMWPVGAPASQDAALRTLLSRVRSAVGANALSGREELTLALPEPVWVDIEAAATELGRAQQALDRGDARGAWALAQVPLNIAGRRLLPGSQAGWLEPARRELEDIRLQALEVIGRAGLGMGSAQVGSVERSARALIKAEPYRESGYVLLMDALAMRGNVAEGLRVFEQLRGLLRDELGTTPSPGALAAHQRLLRPRGAPVAHDEPPMAPIELPAELQARAQAPLVGRRNELVELTRLWEAARDAGHGVEARLPAGTRVHQLVVLSGDAGIGKTSLAAELANRAHGDGGVVLAGRAQEEGLAPYQPFLEALSHYFSVAPIEDLGAAVREYGPELSRLIPELRRRAPELSFVVEGEPESERYRLFEAFVGLLTAIAERAPILLVLDDLHWADLPTLLLLRHLARAREPARLVVLFAYRTESAGRSLLDAVADLRREDLLQTLEIGGLNERETADLVRQRAGEAPSRVFARALYEETEGNPLFIEEIVRNLVHAGVSARNATASDLQGLALPEGIKQLIARRLDRLGGTTVEMLRAAAVIGREFDSGLLEQLVGLSEEQFLSALEEALGAGVLLEVRAPAAAPRYSFAHALIREALYEGMSTARRARIHRRVGEALEAASDPPLGMLALHFTRAAGPQDAERAISYARRAGERAVSVRSYEEAGEHYARALEVLATFAPGDDGQRLELLLALGEAQVRSGERARASPTFREAAKLAEQRGDGAGLARAAIAASRRYVQQPGVIEADLIEMLERSLAMNPEPTATRVRLLSCLCGALYYSAERERMRPLAVEAARIADDLGEPLAKAYSRAAQRRALWDAPHLPERLVASTEMLTLARQVGDLELELNAHAWLVVDLLESGNPDAVDAQIAVFEAGAAALRQPLYEWQALVWRAMRAFLAGALDDAELAASEALAAGAPAESVTAPQYYAIQLLTIRREQRRMGELEQSARELVESNPDRPAWRAALATVLMEDGRPSEARAEFDRLAAREFEDIPQDGDWLTTMSLLCDLCADLGDSQRAALLHSLLEPYAEFNVVVGIAAVCLGPAARLLGRLAHLIGRRREAAALFERALEFGQRLRAPVWLAHTQLDYAAALEVGIQRSRLLQDAERTAEWLGLPKVAARAALLRSQRRALPSRHSWPRLS